jgi:hypothetical protein
METTFNERAAKINDFFYLQPPKPLTAVFKVRAVICLVVYFPIAKLVFGNGLLAFGGLSLILLLVFLFWYKPRTDKQINYDNRVSPETLNNWLLESFKTKILNRAIECLEIEAKDFKPEQFILIPYPVFHCTKKIMDDQIQRVKTEYFSYKKKDEPEVSYYNYSFWNVQVLILSKNYISYYFCSYNWLKDEILNEKSNEYFYQDIALIKTSNEEVNFISKWHEQPIQEARFLKLIHYSGDVLQLIAEIPELQQAPQTIVNLEKVEKTMRILMRHVRASDESKKQVNIEFSNAVNKGETIEV